MLYNFFTMLFIFAAAFPLVFKFFGEDGYQYGFAYKNIVEPARWGGVWSLLYMIFIKDDAFAIQTNTASAYVEVFFIAIATHYLVDFFLKSFELFGRSFADRNADQHRQGQQLTSAVEVVKMIRSRKIGWRFSIGNVPIPVDAETRGFLISGAPGTGKSQQQMAKLDVLMKTDARGIIADPSAGFLVRYHREDSRIFNPFDARSIDWSPFCELEDAWDSTTLAKSIIPDGEGSSAEWNGYAQTFIEAVLLRLFEVDSDEMNATKAMLTMHREDALQRAMKYPDQTEQWNARADLYDKVLNLKANNGEIFRLGCIAEMPEIRALLEGTPAAPLVSEDNERMFANVRAIVGSYAKAYSYLNPATGRDGFSIKKFVMTGKGWLFITYRQDQRAALSPLIGAILDIASRALLTTKPDLNRRFCFELDEFPLLGKVSSIVELLTNGRKHGAMVTLGIQSIAQLRQAYGQQTAQVILSCLGTWMILRANDAETAAYLASHVGKQEVMRQNLSGGKTESGTSENWAQQVVTTDILQPSTIQNLPDLQGFLNIVGDYPVCPILLGIVEQVADRCTDFQRVQRQEFQMPQPIAPAPAPTLTPAPAASPFPTASSASPFPTASSQSAAPFNPFG